MGAVRAIVMTIALIGGGMAGTSTVSAGPAVSTAFRTAAVRAGRAFQDCRGCPDMIVIPAGRFTLGSPDAEPGRGKDEGPQQDVAIARPFAVSRHEITRAQYARFVHATGRPVAGGCITDRRNPGTWAPDARTDFRDPGFVQTGRHPVACVSWADAQAYAAWLGQRTGARYRLLTEAEWEYAARAGSTTAYPWGADAADGCRYMNGADAAARRKYAKLDYVADFGNCNDHRLNTAPVGSYQPNRFGLYDMIGNVGEWVADCSGAYGRAAADPGVCERRVVRGGSWGTVARQLRSAERVNQRATDLDDSIGIRVARELD